MREDGADVSDVALSISMGDMAMNELLVSSFAVQESNRRTVVCFTKGED